MVTGWEGVDLEELVQAARKVWPELGWRLADHGVIYASRGGRWTLDHVARLTLGYDASLDVIWTSPKALGPGWSCTFQKEWPNGEMLRAGWAPALREIRPMWCKAHLKDWTP